MRLPRVPLLLLVLACCTAPGCASTRRSAPPPPPTRPPTEVATRAEEQPDVPEGIFHRVEAGQTLWRIARAYGVDWQALARANRIGDPQDLATGQVLFVPGAKVALEVAPYPAAPPPAAPPATTPPRAAEAGTLALRWPVPGGSLLSPFGAPRRGHRHAGLDIRGELGQDVLAADDGEVVFSGDSLGAYGKLVILEHEGCVETLYAHNSELLVKQGDRVTRGQTVARVGRTGNASAHHCHFELRKNKVPVDPTVYFSDAPVVPEGEPTVASESRGWPAGAGNTSRGKAAAK